MGTRNVKTTPKQKQAMDSLLTCRFKSKRGAMIEAGYSKETANQPKTHLMKRRGVRLYLRQIEKEMKKIVNGDLRGYIMDVLFQGTCATKWVKVAANGRMKKVPDQEQRLKYAKLFTDYFGWQPEESQLPDDSHKQYNFFMINKEEREEFTKKFLKFMRKEYI